MRGPKISVVQLFLDASAEDEEAVPPRTTTCINFANLEDTLDNFIEDPIEELINSIYEGEPEYLDTTPDKCRSPSTAVIILTIVIPPRL